MTVAALEIDNLNIHLHSDGEQIHIVRDVSLRVAPGEVVGLVGESGSGKSVTMMSVASLLDRRVLTTRADRLEVAGQAVLQLDGRGLQRLRGPQVAYVFQDPLSALNPFLSVGRQIAEGINRHQRLSREEAHQRALELLEKVGIAAPEVRIKQRPHQFSGGMRQRVMIAMALALQPRLLIADEPTTALDVTVQAEIVRLVQSIQRETGMAMIWVTHDLALLARVAQRVVVMYAGRIVEDVEVGLLYEAPAHPYTAGLLASTSRIDDPFSAQTPIHGSPPDPRTDPPGCSFAPRCPSARPRCLEQRPSLGPLADGRRVACFYPLHGARP